MILTFFPALYTFTSSPQLNQLSSQGADLLTHCNDSDAEGSPGLVRLGCYLVSAPEPRLTLLCLPKAHSAPAIPPKFRVSEGLKRETEGQMWPDVPTMSWLETISPVAFRIVPLSKEVVDER